MVRCLGAVLTFLALTGLILWQPLVEATLPWLESLQGYAPTEAHRHTWSLFALVVLIHAVYIGGGLFRFGADSWRRTVAFFDDDLPLSSGTLYSPGAVAALSLGWFWIVVIAYVVHDYPSLLSYGLYEEDGLMENLTVVGCLWAAGLFLVAQSRPTKSRWKRGSFILLALFFFFVAMEEISWGQRLLGIETPSWMAEQNLQGETNLHNLEFIDLDSLYRFSACLLFLAYVAGAPAIARRWDVAVLLPHPSTIPSVELVVVAGLLTRQEPFEQGIASLGVFMGWRACALAIEDG